MPSSTQQGILTGSLVHFFSPSEAAHQLYYYLNSCGYYYCSPGYEVDRQAHGDFMLLYVFQGKLSITSEGRTLVADKGKAAFIDCHKPFEYHSVGGLEFAWVHFDGVNTAQLHDYITAKLRSSFVFPMDVNFGQDIAAIATIQDRRLVLEAEYSRYLYNLLTEMSGAAGRSIPDVCQNPVLNAAMEYIDANIEKDFSVKDVAGHVGMSPYHFSRFFKQMTGNSPHDYVVLCRINKAKHLLQTTGHSVKEIAFMVGYNSVSNFITSFNAKVGISPSRFRKYPI